MLTIREAKQRAEVNRGTIVRDLHGSWHCWLNEWTAHYRKMHSVRFDDIEDAVLWLGRQRKQANVRSAR